MSISKEDIIESNQKQIRFLNPDAKVEYPVEYASLDNNALFVAARIINSLGYDFFDYEDIFKQDFLASAGYVEHYKLDDKNYIWRSVPTSLKIPFKKSIRNKQPSSKDAMEYNTKMITDLYPILWSYCSARIISNAGMCTTIAPDQLKYTANMQYGGWLYNICSKVLNNDILDIFTPIIVGIEESDFIKEERGEIIFFEDMINTDNVFFKELFDVVAESFKDYFNLFEQLSISLVKDCCMLINQIKMNMAAGRDIMTPIYNTPYDNGIQQPMQDITQEVINEMAATAEPELLDGLSAEKLMPSSKTELYAKEPSYTEVEMDIVRYIVQDMIDAARAV